MSSLCYTSTLKLFLRPAFLVSFSHPPSGTHRIFSGLFIFECAAKILSLGFIVGPHSYLREPWNWIDFVVVIVGILDFVPDTGDDSSPKLSALRAMRVMRPLRVVNKFPEVRDTVT